MSTTIFFICKLLDVLIIFNFKKLYSLFTVFCVRDSCRNPFLRLFQPQIRLFHNISFLLEFNERSLQQIARPLGNAQKTLIIGCFI
ncbi:hypothetical protein B0A58_14095 [Flavobacterium branchiophilum NBRC 15030 = ATCC 35035]|nr:hypothetical protein B0A58_14095 [Flavobacterium branchiophilum NBRC 15030 = ATCC 35035]